MLIEREGAKEIKCAEVPPVIEPRRQHTDDFMRLTVNPDGSADDIVSAAEALLPAALAENDDVVVSRYIFPCEKNTA